ncbi:MAG: lysoplasmalogenase, partial [Mesorhizobium sp.]
PLFLQNDGGLDVLGAQSWRGAIALAMAAFAIVMLAALWRRVGPSLRLPIAIYVGAILAMGISALTTSNSLVIGGAILFMASDGLLAAEKFLLAAISPHRVWMRYAVWALYYAAQAAISLGFLLG